MSKPIVFALSVLLLAGCTPTATSPTATPSAVPTGAVSTPAPTTSTSTPSPAATGEAHHHLAPHGGTLVVLGQEAAHLELVLDQASGKLSVYVLNGEATAGVASTKRQTMALEFKEPFAKVVELLPQADTLTGETEDKTSHYMATVEELKNVKEFDAALKSVEVLGQTYTNVDLDFPEGNESHAAGHEDHNDHKDDDKDHADHEDHDGHDH